MFWEFYQQSQISRANQAASRATRSADRVEERSKMQHEQLEAKIGSLALTCQALAELLHETAGITSEQLEAKMEEIDLRDGIKDGRITPVSKACTKCGRRTSRTRAFCLYCGGSTAAG